jgi:dTMP kinase
MSGAFIVIEGPDGSGTTTHCHLLADHLESEGYSVLRTAEPSSGPIGTWIREILTKKVNLGAAALQTLFVADRAWHTEQVIAPALAKGDVVVCDRYALSTMMYGEALGLDAEWLEDMNKNFIQPSSQILLLPPLSVSQARLGKRSEKDLLEGDDFQSKVHACYASWATDHPEVSCIDSSGEEEKTAQDIFAAVNDALPVQ